MSSPTKAGAKKTMAFGKVDEFIVIVHGDSSPSDEEWAPWIEYNRRHFAEGGMVKLLIVTDGGAPSATQRQLTNETLAEFFLENPKAVRGAIVTASTFVRGVVTALSWFNPGYTAFSPERMDDALKYLEVPPDRRPDVLALIKSLKAQLPTVDESDKRRGFGKR